MSTTSNHAHVEPLRKAAGVNADGTETKAKTPAIITKPSPTVIAGGSPYMAGNDRSRTPAKAPASTVNGDFIPVTSMTGVGGLRPGEIEVLARHGINVGLRAGVLTIERKYHLSASAVLFAARGQ